MYTRTSSAIALANNCFQNHTNVTMLLVSVSALVGLYLNQRMLTQCSYWQI